MEKEQYNLFRKDYTEIPNVYFDLQKNYSSASKDTPTIDMNPNKISEQCSNIPNNPLSASVTTNDVNYNFYVNNNGNFNNFVYKYATGEESMNFDEPVKNQLEYLGCQIFKNKNKKFDTNNFTYSQFTFDKIASIIAIIVVIWCLSSYFIHVFKGRTNNFFDKFKNIKTKNLSITKKIGSLIILIIITGGILAWITFSSNMTTPTVDLCNNVIDGNIVFYNNNNSNDADVQNSINTSKVGFFLFLLLIFSIYFGSQYFIKHSGVVYLICTVIFIIGIILLFCFNNIQDQSINVEENDYNTGKEIYQSILNGIKQNFKYIIILLVIALISYIALIAFNKNIETRSNWGILIPIVLLSSFAFFLPILILLFELCFAIVNPLGFGLSIVIMRFILYIISYILGTFATSAKFTPKLLSVLFEYPESYMDKFVSPSTIPNIASTNYPKNNPSGMPWNTLSMNISKIIVGIISLFSVPNLNQTYFGRMLN